jgi:hypothetical protein
MESAHMKPIFGHETPLVIRVLCAGAACFAALFTALTVAMRGEHPTALTVVVVSGIAFGGFIALSVAGTLHRPRLPLHITMGLATLAAVAVLMGLPWPPRASSIGSQVALFTVLALTGATALSLGRHPARALVLLLLLAVVGVMLAISAIVLAGANVLPPTARFPVWQVAIIIGALLAAAWHGRVLRNDPPGWSPQAAV